MKRIKLSIRRELSKSYGDLSNLRPKSPPIQTLPAGLHGRHLSPGNYVDDTQTTFSPSYNRQGRQAIPNNWMTGVSGSHPSNTREELASTGLQNYLGPLYGIRSRHVEAEPATISIQGLTSGYIQPLDFCVPVTRSHPGDEDQRHEALHGDTGRNLTVEHIDMSTVWNGLSDIDAHELFRVHRAFVSTLERMLANELWQIYQQLQQQDSAGNIRPIHTLFTTGIVRGISFCRDQLVSEMAEALYSSRESSAKAKSGLLRLYLIATDALVQHQGDGSRDTSITIRMRCDPFALRSHPVVDAAWVPDSLMFEGLNEHPLEGQTFSIVPRYYSKSAFRPTHFPKNVRYSVESEPRHSPLPWLVWDNEIAGFKGIVPFYSEFNGYGRHFARTCRDPCEPISKPLKIIVQAVLVDDNGSAIRYERILRVRLALNVVPWYANNKSREIKERSSGLEAYQDTRVASAAQAFAVRGPRGSPLGPGQSPSRLSQWSKGANLHMPNEYVHLGRFGSKNKHLAISSSATEARLKETDSPSLAQTQEYLVAKCAELTRELENVKEQVKMSGPFSEHHKRVQHVSDTQKYLNDTCSVPSSRHTEHNGPITESAVPRTSHHTSERLTAPSSPSIHGKHAIFQPGPTPRFPVLPPSEMGLTTRSTLVSQTSDDGDALDVPCTGRYLTPTPSTTSQIAAPEEDLMTPNTDFTQEPGHPWPLPEQASISSNCTGTAHSSPRQHVEALLTPPMVTGELATLSTSRKRGRQGRPRTSLNKSSPPKRLKATAKLPEQKLGAHFAQPGKDTLTLSDSENEESSNLAGWSSGIFYNSFGPLRNFRSSTTLAGEDALTIHASETKAHTGSGENVKHRKQDSGCGMDTRITDSDELADKASRVSSGLDDGATAADGIPSKLVSTDWEGQVRLRRSSSASLSRQHASTSSTSGSRSTSSDMEFIVEQNLGACKLSHQEQARRWKLLSQPDSGKEKQPEPEVRLSEDEKKAFSEAIRRSLDDLARGVDDILLEDSSDSNSDDDL